MTSVWKSPFLRQCFVTSGVAINLGAGGMITGYTTGMLDQLRRPDSAIPIDSSTGSWIASLPSISIVGVIFIVPTLMSRFGRRTTNFISTIPMITGWLCIIFATNPAMFLAARLIQGLGAGIFLCVGSLLVGEYTSPRNRGMFLMILPICLSFGITGVHCMGSYLTWHTTAIVNATIVFINMIIILLSPESPGWLVDKERYDDCRRSFRWLRGNNEEVELKKMIEAKILATNSETRAEKESLLRQFYNNVLYFKNNVVKKEFYKPLIIMIHVYAIAQWCGANIVTPYADELIRRLTDGETDVPVQVLALGAQRIVANILGIYIIKKIKRRTLFLVTTWLSIGSLLAVAAYTFAKEKGVLPFHHFSICIVFTHFMMIAFSAGSVSLSYVIAGEIFPLEYKSVAGTISILSLSLNMFISVKTLPYFFDNYGIHGSYCIYVVILLYCFGVTWMYLPETKDRTLQDIEEEFRGRPITSEELKTVQPLTSEKAENEEWRVDK